MAPPKLTLYLDIVSPFAHIAFHVLENSPVFKNVEKTYIPMLLGGVMAATHNTPPLKILNKSAYTERERSRWSKLFRVPMLSGMPEGFPPNTITAQRALCAIERDHPEKLVESFQALYAAFWVEGRDIKSQDVIVAALVPVLGEQATKDIMGKVGEPEVKKHLATNTDAAIKDGAFGLPWFVCTNPKGEREGFWGVDHLGVVCEFLGLDRGAEKGLRSML